VWDDGVRRVKSLKHEGCFIDHREMLTFASPENVFRVLRRVINNPNLCVEVNEPTQRIIVRDKDQRPGDKWIEWRVGRTASPTYLTQSVFFSPRGLPGFLYWYLLYPLHVINSRAQLRKIAQRSENQ
jgi:hypothetical protein